MKEPKAQNEAKTQAIKGKIKGFGMAHPGEKAMKKLLKKSKSYRIKNF